MRRKATALVLGFGLAFGSAAHAAGPPVAAVSAASLSVGLTASSSPDPPAAHPVRGTRAQRWLFLDAPPPAPPPFPPDPAPEADEHARRTWELVPEAGVGAPFCRGGGAIGCVGAGPSFAAAALYRFTPYLAFGLDAAFANFRDATGVAGGHSRANWVGLVVRGYFAERGAVDPYVEVGFGRGAVDSGGGDVRISGSAPSTMARAGVDLWVLPYLRLGPALSYRWTWLSSLDVCQAGTCGTASAGDLGAVGSYASLGLVVTLAMGHEM
jgi:hypothetical protein